MIPLADTTVTVTRQTEAEPGEGITSTVRARHLRAVIASPTGSAKDAPGGGTEVIDAVLVCDPLSTLDRTDRVTDGTTVYQVAWVTQRPGLLAHTRAGLIKVSGRAA